MSDPSEPPLSRSTHPDHAPALDELPIGIVVQSPEGTPLYVNATGAALLTKARSRTTDGLPFGRDWPLFDANGGMIPVTRRPLARAIDTKKSTAPALFTFRTSRDTGALVLTASPVVAEDGEVHAVTSVFLDVGSPKGWSMGSLASSSECIGALALHAVLVVDHKLRLKTFNLGAQDLFGGELGIELQKNISLSEQLPESLAQGVQPRLSRALVGLAESVEFSITNRDGKQLWLAGEFTPLSVHNTRFALAALVNLDHANALFDHRQLATTSFQQRTLDAMDRHVVLLDGDGQIAVTNLAWRRFAESLATRDTAPETTSFAELATLLLGESNAASILTRIEEVVSGSGSNQQLEYRLDDRSYLVRISKLAGWQSGVLITQDPIEPPPMRGESRISSRPPSRSNEVTGTTFRAVLNGLDEAVFLFDKEERALFMNAAALARAPSSVDGDEPVNLSALEGPFFHEIRKAVQSAQEHQRLIRREFRDPRSSSTWEVAAAPLRDVGDGPTTMVATRDITAATETSRMGEEGETLAAMGALVAGVAHEVRNPLFGISSTLDAFEARFTDCDEQQEYLRVLRQEVARLSTLMGDLLDYGRPAVLSKHRMSVAEPLLEAMDSCKTVALKGGVRLCAPEEPTSPTIVGDKKRLVQVFGHILENAVQHAPRNSEVSVELRQVDDDRRTWVECTISDRGPGFRAEALQKAFDLFFTRRPGGTGFGLALVRRIVYEHGGRAMVRNREGGGAVVTVWLPAGSGA